jgi:hypothetical protein
MLSFFLGTELATKIVNRKFNINSLQKTSMRTPVFYFTTLGILTRVTIMLFNLNLTYMLVLRAGAEAVGYSYGSERKVRPD